MYDTGGRRVSGLNRARRKGTPEALVKTPSKHAVFRPSGGVTGGKAAGGLVEATGEGGRRCFEGQFINTAGQLQNNPTLRDKCSKNQT